MNTVADEDGGVASLRRTVVTLMMRSNGLRFDRDGEKNEKSSVYNALRSR
jgi:hypothetical protein